MCVCVMRYSLPEFVRNLPPTPGAAKPGAPEQQVRSPMPMSGQVEQELTGPFSFGYELAQSQSDLVFGKHLQFAELTPHNPIFYSPQILFEKSHMASGQSHF